MPYSDRWKQARAANDHYRRNSDAMKERAKQAKQRQVTLLVGYMQRAKEVPCTDCGNEYPHYVMDFDHVRGMKKANVTDLARKPVTMRTLRMEIAKCEVVCSNCHRIRTWERAHTEAPVVAEADALVDDLRLFD